MQAESLPRITQVSVLRFVAAVMAQELL